MITELTARQILEDVESLGNTDGAVFAVAPLHAITLSNGIVRDSDSETTLLRESLSRYSFCIEVDIRRYLQEIPIFACSVPQFLAYANKRRGQPYIVIFTGVLDAALYRLSFSILLSNLLNMLKVRSSEFKTAADHLGTLGQSARDLSLNCFDKLNELPIFLKLLNEKHRQQILDGMHGCLTYVALHEIGHIIMGHCGASHSQEEERVNEFAADQFAFQCIREEHRMSFITNMMIAFDLYSDKERLLGASFSHPCAIDRIDSIATVVKAYDDDFFAKKVSFLLDDRKSASWKPSATNDEAMKALDTLVGMYDGVDYPE
jgi:hypothetical protein